jgi:pimeloyl-ACP methyl ester carboxylesterase
MVAPGVTSSDMKPPILFIHGAFTRAQRWRPWLEFFRAAGYECFAPSLPGMIRPTGGSSAS